MTPSTTNTAARELLASALDECGRPTDAAEVREGRNPFVRGEYALAAIEKTLTQQQGGEQEAIAAVWHRARNAWMRQSRHGTQEQADAAAIEILTTALRSKQPAASEGDVCACGGDYGPGHKCRTKRGPTANTSKQAAGEAVAERRAPVQGYQGGTVPWHVHRLAWEGYAKDYGKQQSAERIAERGGFYAVEMDEYVPNWRELATTPPRHPAEEGMARALLERWQVEIGQTMVNKYWSADQVAAMQRALAAIQAGTP